MASLEVHARNFYNLEGITLMERNKNFNIYLNEIKKTVSTPEDRQMYCSLLHPRNRLEEVLYTQILLHLQDSCSLLNLLTSNHVLLPKTVLKSKLCVEILKNNFDEITSEEFLKRICFLDRLRILVRFGLIFQDDQRLDNYYRIIKKQYGLHLAKYLLPACNLETLTVEMNENCIVFNNNQLTKLHNRFPNFLEEYFKHLKENNFKDFKRFDRVIRQIAQTDSDLYFELLRKYELKTKISISSTIKFVQKYKLEVLKNGEKYLEIMHKHTAFRQLTSNEFPLLFEKFFPKSFNDVNVDLLFSTSCDVMKSLVKRFSRKYRFIVLNNVFKKLYNTDLLDREELISEQLLEMVPDNLREPIIIKKIAKDNKDDWLIFYEPEKALKMIKEKISKTTDPTKRRNLVNCLVKTCKVNNDIPKLAEVFKYIITRHRNEDASLFSNVLLELDEIDTEKFNADHWEGLNKIHKIYLINKQVNHFYYSHYKLSRYEEGYWSFKIKNNLSITEDVTNYIKRSYKDYHLSLFQDRKYKKERMIVMNILGEMIACLFKDIANRAKSESVANFFMHTIVDHNSIFIKDKISMYQYPFLIKYIADIMNDTADEDNQRSYIFGLLETLQLGKESESYNKVCDELWKGKPENYEYKWDFFLKRHPKYIKDNYEQFFALTYIHSGVHKFIENVQYYSHLGIPELFNQKSKEIIMESEYIGVSTKYNLAVRFLVNSNEFISVTERFLPTKSYESTAEDEEVNVVQIKKTICEVFGNYKYLEDALKPVLALAKSDYLKYCLKSIYKIAYNLPETKLKHFMEQIADGRISLKKHVIFIMTRISEQQKVYETLKTIGMNEKDASFRKYLIKSTLSYFNKNPSEEFFQLVKDHCKLLTGYDSEACDLLVTLDRIPIRYLARYVEFIWEFTQSSIVDEVKEIKYKSLQKLDEDLMKSLKPEFLDTLVTKCLDFEKLESDKMYDFINRYIIIGDLEDAPKRANFVVSQFPKIVTAKEVQLSKNLLKFTLGFCEKIFAEHKNDNGNAKIILAKFTEVWNRSYNLENSFEQATALELAEFFLLTKTYNPSLMVMRTSGFLNSLLRKYGNYIIPNFATTFRNQFYAFMKIQEIQDDDELFKFMLEFLQVERNIPEIDREYFVLMTLSKTLPKSANAKEKYLKILETLEKSEAISIRISVSCYINSLEEKIEENMSRFRPICNMRC